METPKPDRGLEADLEAVRVAMAALNEAWAAAAKSIITALQPLLDHLAEIDAPADPKPADVHLLLFGAATTACCHRLRADLPVVARFTTAEARVTCPGKAHK